MELLCAKESSGKVTPKYKSNGTFFIRNVDGCQLVMTNLNI